MQQGFAIKEEPMCTDPITIHSSQSQLKQYDFEDDIRACLERAGYSKLDDVNSRLCVMDLSKSTWHDLGTLLWLITLLYKLKRQGNELQLIFPEPQTSTGEKLWDF